MTKADSARTDVETPSDLEIVDRVRQGDSASFELLMRRYNRRLYRIARGILHNEAEAEDAVQEAYVLAFEKLHLFANTGPFSAWLARIAVNEALGRLRVTTVEKRSLSLDTPQQREGANLMAELTFAGPSPEQDAARSEYRRLLEQAIDALPDSYRPVFVLRGLEELTVAETADCLDVAQATVKTRYHRARKILQQHLAELVQSVAGEAFPFAGERCDRIVAGVFRRLKLRDEGLAPH